MRRSVEVEAIARLLEQARATDSWSVGLSRAREAADRVADLERRAAGFRRQLGPLLAALETKAGVRHVAVGGRTGAP